MITLKLLLRKEPQISKTIKIMKAAYERSLSFRIQQETFYFGCSASKAERNFKYQALRLVEALILFIILLSKLFARYKNFSPSRKFSLFSGLTGTQFIPKSEQSLLDFYEFVNEDRFKLKQIDSTVIFVEHRTLGVFQLKKYKNIYCAKYLEILLFHQIKSKKTRLLVLIEITKRLLLTIFSKKTRNSIYGNFKSFIVTEPLWILSDQNNLRYLLTTQSEALLQPYFFYYMKDQKKVERHMFWYSANHSDLMQLSTYEGLKFDDFIQSIEVDNHFVWNETDALRFKDFEKNTTICGSILFYPHRLNRQNTAINKQLKHSNLVIFDMTPRSDAPAISLYTESKMTKFLIDIIESVEELELNIDIFLKTKRNYQKKNNRQTSYTHVIYELQEQGRLSLVSANENLYELAQIVDIAISIPYTSTGVVMYERRVPHAYYWPVDANLYVNAVKPKEMDILYSKSELKNWVKKQLLEKSSFLL